MSTTDNTLTTKQILSTGYTVKETNQVLIMKNTTSYLNIEYFSELDFETIKNILSSVNYDLFNWIKKSKKCNWL